MGVCKRKEIIDARKTQAQEIDVTRSTCAVSMCKCAARFRSASVAATPAPSA